MTERGRQPASPTTGSIGAVHPDPETILARLNPEQREAATATTGPVAERQLPC
jgi:hypothetical protein